MDAGAGSFGIENPASHPFGIAAGADAFEGGSIEGEFGKRPPLPVGERGPGSGSSLLVAIDAAVFEEEFAAKVASEAAFQLRRG